MLRQATALLLLILAGGTFSAGQTPSHPPVRAITAFVRIDRDHYREQLGAALKVLRLAKAKYTQAGFPVQTIRITTQPFPEYLAGLARADKLRFLGELDAMAKQEDFLPNIGPAFLQAGDGVENIELLGEVLSTTTMLEASAIIAAEDGIHWEAIRATGRMVKYVAEHSPRSQGNFNFTASGMLAPYTPFYPGSYHLGPGKKFAVGLEGADVVREVFQQTGYDPPAAVATLTAALTRHLQAAEAVAKDVAAETGWEYLGIDPTPAPNVNASIGAAIEAFTGKPLGSPGTLTAAAVITQAVKAVPVKQIGYSGLMLPILEDARISQRWSEGRISLDTLLSYSSVCATGLDTVPLPGDMTAEQLARIIGDVAVLAYKWKKPLTARLQPVRGRKAGEASDFDDPMLKNAKLQPVP